MEMAPHATLALTVFNATQFQVIVLSAMLDSSLQERIVTLALRVRSHQDRSVINVQDAHNAVQRMEIVRVAWRDSAYREPPANHAVAELSLREAVVTAPLAVMFARHAIIPMDSVPLATQDQE
jgi:hypothetical protein